MQADAFALQTPPTSPIASHETQDVMVVGLLTLPKTGAKLHEQVPFTIAPGEHHGEGVTEGVTLGVTLGVALLEGVIVAEDDTLTVGEVVGVGAITHVLLPAAPLAIIE